MKPTDRNPPRQPSKRGSSWRTQEAFSFPASAAFSRASHLEWTRGLLVFGGLLVLYLVIWGRLLQLGIAGYQAPGDTNRSAVSPSGQNSGQTAIRARILDRNGVLLAATLPSMDLGARPGKLLRSPEDVAQRLSTALTDLDTKKLIRRLESGRDFVWITRKLTPEELRRVQQLGMAGLVFVESHVRIYPKKNLFAHVVGFVDIDGRGLAGAERAFNDRLARVDRAKEAVDADLRLSVDTDIQYVVREELAGAIDAYQARTGSAIVMDAISGEVLALVSLPDFNPTLLQTGRQAPTVNVATMNLYEQGSTFKIFNTVLALDRGNIALERTYDVGTPVRVGRFRIADPPYISKPVMNVAEIFVHSSNVGSAMIALEVGWDRQERLLSDFGLTRKISFELGETSAPLISRRKGDTSLATTAYGYGIAISPLHSASAVAQVVNGGYPLKPTILPPADPAQKNRPDRGQTMISSQTTAAIRGLLYMNTEVGTGMAAQIDGHAVGGKTGTAQKVSDRGGYDPKRVVNSFVAAFPIDDPRYVLHVVLDEPQPQPPETRVPNAGSTAAPLAGKIIRRLVGILRLPSQESGDGVAIPGSAWEVDDLRQLVSAHDS